jgi:hypothetical protein
MTQMAVNAPDRGGIWASDFGTTNGANFCGKLPAGWCTIGEKDFFGYCPPGVKGVNQLGYGATSLPPCPAPPPMPPLPPPRPPPFPPVPPGALTSCAGQPNGPITLYSPSGGSFSAACVDQYVLLDGSKAGRPHKHVGVHQRSVVYHQHAEPDQHGV